MKQRTISISPKAYKYLMQVQRVGESLSDIILRLCTSVEQDKEPFSDLLSMGSDIGDFWADVDRVIARYRDEHQTGEGE